MNAESFSQLTNAVIMLLSTLITVFLIPYLKQKYSVEKRKQAYQTVKIIVQSVEQVALAQNWNGAEKKAKVVDYLDKLGIKLNANELDKMIESAVLELARLEQNVIEP